MRYLVWSDGFVLSEEEYRENAHEYQWLSDDYEIVERKVERKEEEK